MGRAMSALCLAAALALPALARGDADGSTPPSPLAAAATAAASPLDLRLSSVMARDSLPAGMPRAPGRSILRLQPRKSLIERGVEGSREALVACQRGAYPGATVTASGVQVSGGDAQPDHCYRF